MRRINFGGAVKATARSLVTWSWTKRLLYWLIISAGTMSELVFLVASLWVSVNANVHSFVLLFLPEETTIHITELATTAYVALPECIVGLAVVITISHIRMVMYNKKDYPEIIWSILFGVPTIIFLVLSLITLGNAVASITFQMPTPLVVIRALAAFAFAFASLLYWYLGIPQEKDRLAKKDAMLEDLRREKDTKIADLARETDAKITDLEKENHRLSDLITQQNQDLETQKKQQSDLLKALDESTKSALQAYSQDCQDWLMSGIKSVSLDEITRFTGHSKRKVNNAIAAGKIQPSPRNKTLMLVSSLVEWLEQNPPTNEETKPDLYVVNG